MVATVDTMAKWMWCLVLLALMGDCVFGGPAPTQQESKRVARGYGYGDSSGGFGRSDERDASVSGENGCNDSGYGRGYNSGSRELAYNRDGRNSDPRGGRSFARSAASAVASASAYTMKQRSNVL